MTLRDAVQDAKMGKSRLIRCSVHDDHTPSLSVSQGSDGWVLIHCFGGCDPEDILAAERLTWADLFGETAREKAFQVWTKPQAKRQLPWDESTRSAKRADWTQFLPPTAADLELISKIRGLSREGLHLAVIRGILRVTICRNGHRCWVITDASRFVAQVRRLDGQKFRTATSEEKALSLPGSTHKWPAGIAALNDDHRSVILTEGGPDLLAAFHFIACEGRERDTTAVGILGAGSAIHEDLLPRFRGRRVRIAQHADKPGRAAAECWAEQLRPYVEHVDGIDFTGLRQQDEKPVKDLNDLVRIHSDDFAAHTWIRSIIP